MIEEDEYIDNPIDMSLIHEDDTVADKSPHLDPFPADLSQLPEPIDDLLRLK
jgi:hypothetical protein